ncbi:MAG: nucleotide sugar dehydrogenase [Tissierellia bacterium]|nr:nucleotide sugar dehydrogenase [Tissierellia bacterium]
MFDIKNKKMFVVGLGYIGLPTAAMFSMAGFSVLGYDKDERVVERLNSGAVYVEEGVTELIDKGLKEGNLKGVSQYEEADIFIIAVPTPIKEDKSPEMSMVLDAAENIGRVIKKGNLVILESTSPPKTTTDLIAPKIRELSGLEAGKDYYLAHSPERVIPGNLLNELVNNHRIIGGVNLESAEAAKACYETFVKADIYLTDSTTAELAKLMENTFRDVNIGLANETARICEDLGVNVWELISLANKHPRVNLHTPGPGVGGHCIAVDPWFIVYNSKNANIINLGRKINDSVPDHVYSMVKDIIPKGKLTILGLTYKPNTDDFRESPVVELAKKLIADPDYEVSLTDPYGENKQLKVAGLEIKKDHMKALEGSDLLIMGVNHKDYDDLDLSEIGKVMNTKTIFDTRNSISREEAEKAGFKYILLGDGKHA